MGYVFVLFVCVVVVVFWGVVRNNEMLLNCIVGDFGCYWMILIMYDVVKWDVL